MSFLMLGIMCMARSHLSWPVMKSLSRSIMITAGLSTLGFSPERVSEGGLEKRFVVDAHFAVSRL